MKTWNIGNTTVRNPFRLREALALFVQSMARRPFREPEQIEFQGVMIDAGLVDSERRDGADGARKFAAAFKQLGLVTDWSRGKAWEITPIGQSLLGHPEIEHLVFLRQLLKYQIPSPLEAGAATVGFHVRPFRLLMKFLVRANDEGLVGLTKDELGLFVITLLTDDDDQFEAAVGRLKAFRDGYARLEGKVRKAAYARQQLDRVATRLGLEKSTLLDYADSSSRYGALSGMATIKGNKLIVSPARLAFVRQFLADGSTLLPNADYLAHYYDPAYPPLPTDDRAFLTTETRVLIERVEQIAGATDEAYTVPAMRADMTVLQLQAAEQQLRDELRRIREIQFYREQGTVNALREIEDLLENIRDKSLVGNEVYAPAFFEWAVWRLFLAINHLVGLVSDTRGFPVDEDIQPIHHARGGAADLRFVYDDFVVVCEMTLTTNSRQFAAEGEPVTRHVHREIQRAGGKPVYGLFIAPRIDPNTADAFHNARYWQPDGLTVTPTPIVSLELEHVLALVRRMQVAPFTVAELKATLVGIVALQRNYDNGPAWYRGYVETLVPGLGQPPAALAQ